MGTARYPQTGKKANFSLGTANANRDGTGTLATMLAGGDLVADEVSITFIVTTTQGMIRFYASPDNGSTNNLIGEVYVPAWTPSATVPALSIPWKVPKANRNLYTANDLLRASIEKAESAKGEISYHTMA